jgi:SAM-dependent methyltransferase
LPVVYPAPAPRRLPIRSLFYLHRQVLLDALYAAAPFIRGRVLDVGCFDKPYVRDFGARAERWIGVDRPAYSQGRPQADVFGDACALPVRAAAVDTVLCTQVLDDLPDPQRLFDEAARVLRPGGALVLTAPQYSPPHDEPGDYYRFSRFALDLLAQRAGLRTMRLVPQGGVVALLAFAAGIRIPVLRARASWVRTLNGALQAAALRADRALQKYPDTLGWVIVAEKAVE